MVWEALACEMPDHIAGVMSMTSIQVGAVVMSSAFGSIPFSIAPGAVIAVELDQGGQGWPVRAAGR